MKKLLPLVALLTTVAFSAPVIANDEAEAPVKKEAAHKEKAGKAHKGHKAGKKAHKGKHGKKPCHKGTAPAMESLPAPKEATSMTPTKVWMPSMRHGFQK